MTDHPNPRPGAARPTIDPAVSTARPTTGPRAGEPRTAADPRISEARLAETYTTARSGDSRSVPELLADLVRSVPELVRQEIQLLRSEMSDKLTQVEIGLGSIVAGGILLFAALLVLLQAIVIALTELVGPGWASLIVGVAVAAVGAVLLKKGIDQMKLSSLMPERTTNQLRQDVDLAKEQTR